MPGKRIPKPSQEEVEHDRLVARSRQNPCEFFGFEDCGQILGFSKRAMGRLNAAGAPVAFRKMNPGLILEWIKDNPEKVASMTDTED